MKKIIIILAFFVCIFNVNSQEFTSYKLKNGLTVYLWPDKNQPDITGQVIVKAGSAVEPLEYTGLAHYLEHVLFKGTQKIGSFDWEKEKPHYQKIIQLYDEYSASSDPIARVGLEKKINEESLFQAQYASTSEFSNLVEGMGGKGLNAGTSYDYTVYYNSFPSFQIEKWLDLYSERMINPVFRSFQAELENVFEEFNMYQDDNNTHVQEFVSSYLYKGHPYERSIIGTPEHLKNPRLSKLIEFYNTWYVPSNMALILTGNFDVEEVKPMIDAKFSRLEGKIAPARKTYSEADFTGNPRYSAKIGYSPFIFFAYKAVPIGHEDGVALDFCASLLSNSANTGLLDKIGLDGEVQYAGAYVDSRKDQGRFVVRAVPYYDSNQRRYDSDKATEKIVMKEIEKLKNGTIDEWLIESVRKSELRNYELMMENANSKVLILSTIFGYELPNDFFAKNIERIKSITKDDIQKVVKKYINVDHLTVSIEAGSPKKNKLKKPDIKPIDQPKGKTSDYAIYLKLMPVKPVAEVYNDFSEVKSDQLYDKINLYHSTNTMNDFFTLTLKYGVGTEKMPKLKYATSLMNSAGIMPNSDAQDVRRKFSELNATCSYRVTDDYFYITLIGSEENMESICRLMAQQILMPKLDDKQLNRVKGDEISNRFMLEQKSADVLGDALLDYAMYKNKSGYIDRLGLKDIYSLTIGELTGEIIRATDYALDIHYVGKKELANVVDILKGNLPLKEGVKASESPIVKDRISYDKPTVYFLPSAEAQQAKVYFYINGTAYKIEDKVNYDAFYQYFSGGFNGLVMNEIRENNSMAYSAYGAMITPPIQNKNAYFLGYVGTQPDKVVGAIELYMKLLTNLPLYPERIDNIKTYLKQTYLSNRPSFRSKSMTFNSWKQLGYTDDPAKINMPKVEKLTFDQIVNFYNEEIKGKPVTILIVGDPKLIDVKSFQEKYGKVTRLSESGLFSKLDL